MSMPKLTLYWLENSRAQRILWLLEELQLQYEIKRFKRNPQTSFAPPELKEIHPLGKSPILTDGDKVLAESGFITQYLVDKYGPQLKPKNEEELLRYNYFLHYTEGGIMQPLLTGHIFAKVQSSPMPFFIRPIVNHIVSRVHASYLDPNYKTHLGFLEQELSGRPWLAGEEFSGADVMISFPLETAALRAGLTEEAYPHLWKYLEKLHERPAYQRALEKGGRYDFVKPKA